MKRFEIIGGLAALAAIIIHFINISGGSLLLIVVLATLSIFYYLLSFVLFNDLPIAGLFKKVSYKNTNKKRLLGSIGLGVAISTLIIGVLFRLLFYPGANFLLLVGTCSLTIAAIVSLIFYFQNHSNFSRTVLKRTLSLGIVGLIFITTPSSVFIDIYYRDFPDYAELYKRSLKSLEIKN